MPDVKAAASDEGAANEAIRLKNLSLETSPSLLARHNARAARLRQGLLAIAAQALEDGGAEAVHLFCRQTIADAELGFEMGLVSAPAYNEPCPPRQALAGALSPLVGERVKKSGGSFQHAGTVVADFCTTSGQQRVVIEFDEPVAGMLHIYRHDQIEVLA